MPAFFMQKADKMAEIENLAVYFCKKDLLCLHFLDSNTAKIGEFQI